MNLDELSSYMLIGNDYKVIDDLAKNDVDLILNY